METDEPYHRDMASGVFIHEQERGTLEDNDIFANAYAGVAIATGGDPVLRRNRIHRNGYGAVCVYRAGAGTIEDNDLRNNKRGAWDIAADSMTRIRRARNQE
jgi:parallel beta-helix repeat protein